MVDTKTVMRRVWAREEAQDLIDLIKVTLGDATDDCRKIILAELQKALFPEKANPKHQGARHKA